MLMKLLLALSLMATCVVIHASGVNWALRRLDRVPDRRWTYWPSTWMLIRLAAWMIVCHLLEICVWALSYWWFAAMPDQQSAIYFSAVTYTTTGYGDLVLPAEWRLVGGVEALTGILMCSWSAAFFFAVLSEMYGDD
jgi:hypothetical protein